MAKITPKTAALALYEATKGKQGKDLESVLANSVVFLKEKQLISKAREILTYLQELIDTDNGVVRAKVESGHELTKKMTDEIESELKKRYDAKEIHLETSVDEKQIAGMKIQIGNEIIDLTMRNKIDQLQNYLIRN
jgi:F-type H+-transporting ATPase subunit delta